MTTQSSPIITEMKVIPVAGHDSMLLNIGGAHNAWFTRNIVVLTDNAGHTGVGEAPGGEVIYQTLLAAIPVAAWGEPVSGPEAAFRNKAKMVVSGSVERPLLGMLHRDGTPVDLTDCPLYPAEFAPVFAALKPFIARAGLTPYNVARKRGELKYLLLTASTHHLQP